MKAVNREEDRVGILSRLVYSPETGAITWLSRPVEDFGGNARIHKSWNARHAGKTAGNVTSTGYEAIKINGRMILSHRVAWVLTHGDWPPEDIDHINGVRTDNRLENLRAVTRMQNNRNAKMRKDNKTGVSGVRFVPRRNKWCAQIGINGKLTYLGFFESFDDAVRARDEAKHQQNYSARHGEIA